MSSAEFVEYMASYQVDQRGGVYDDLRAGAIASTIANIHRDRKARSEPFGCFDMTPWSEHHAAANDAEPVLLDDPEEQAKLIERVMFPRRE
ncbi:phage tail assembly protein T [Cupriavidus phytorum]